MQAVSPNCARIPARKLTPCATLKLKITPCNDVSTQRCLRVISTLHVAPSAISGALDAQDASFTQDDLNFMAIALDEARAAAAANEVPIGAVLVHDGRILARSHNRIHKLRSPLAHAEMLCLATASSKLRAWRLLGTTLYVTVEPCPMCAAAMMQARVGRVVYGTVQPRLGADGSWIQLFPRSNTRPGSDQCWVDRIGQSGSTRAETMNTDEDTADKWKEKFICHMAHVQMSPNCTKNAAIHTNAREMTAVQQGVRIGTVVDATADIASSGHAAVDYSADATTFSTDCSYMSSIEDEAYEDALQTTPVGSAALLDSDVAVTNTVGDAQSSRAQIGPVSGAVAQAVPETDLEVRVGAGCEEAQRPHPFHNRIEVVRGCRAEEAAELMRAFFRRRREERLAARAARMKEVLQVGQEAYQGVCD